MWAVKLLLSVVYVATGILFAWLARASQKGTLRNNPVAGYRTATIMANDDTWRAGHVAAWRWTALVAVLSFVVAVAIACSPQERFLLAVSGGGAVALLALTCCGAAIAQRAAKRVLEEQARLGK